MRLFYSTTSPYAHKVRVAILECGLQSLVEMILASPLDPGSEKIIPNPLGKIPALLLDNGTVLYDSPVICQYLLADGTRPTPDWEELRRQALGDGIIDAAFNSVMERRRPETQQSPMWLAGWEAAVRRSLDGLEYQQFARPTSSFVLGTPAHTADVPAAQGCQEPESAAEFAAIGTGGGGASGIQIAATASGHSHSSLDAASCNARVTL